MNCLADWKAGHARGAGAAPWQNIAESVLSAVHEELAVRLASRPGEQRLDVTTGRAAVALRAARAGAPATALDLSPALASTARRLAAKQRSAIRFAIGHAGRLHYSGESVDVVSSAHEVVFAAVGHARPANADNPRDGRQPWYVNHLAGADFELKSVDATWSWTAESGEAPWRRFTGSDGPPRPASPPYRRWTSSSGTEAMAGSASHDRTC
jgi:Methyltransferase domain